MISRRSLFAFLAAAPLGAVAAVKAAAEPASFVKLTPGYTYCDPKEFHVRLRVDPDGRIWRDFAWFDRAELQFTDNVRRVWRIDPERMRWVTFDGKS